MTTRCRLPRAEEPMDPTPAPTKAPASIDELLEHMVALDASDLHLAVGTQPSVRVNGKLERLDDLERLTPDDTQRLLYRIMSTEQQKHFEVKRQLDLSYAIPGLARF